MKNIENSSLNVISAVSIPDMEFKTSVKHPSIGLSRIRASLRSKIKMYKKRAQEIEKYLNKHPHAWGKFQNEFNLEANSIFNEIMSFEKLHMYNGDREKVHKLKNIFVNKIRDTFDRGEYGSWSIHKPFGYAGDFRIIDSIYENNPSTMGFDRLFDNYFQMSAISVAVRNRKEDFKRIIIDQIKKKKGNAIKIMDLGSGPCREIKEILSAEEFKNRKNIAFDCYDSDERSIEYAKSVVKGNSSVKFFKENVLRLAVDKNISKRIKGRYDLIYSTGLFDYLDYKVSVRLIRNLKELLKKNGVMAISDVRDKYSNPSVHYMEWMGEWNLIYRNDEDFEKIFMDAGFEKNKLNMQYEQQGIMHYIIAGN